MPGDDSNIAVTVRAKRTRRRPAARAPAAEDTEDDGQGSDQEDGPVQDQQRALDTQESDQEEDEERARQEDVEQDIERWRNLVREQEGAVVPQEQEQEQSQSVVGGRDQGVATSGGQSGASSGGQGGARKRGMKKKEAGNEPNKVARKSTRSRPRALNK